MDDLSGLDWSSTTTSGSGTINTNNTLPPKPVNPPSTYPTLRPTPSPQTSARNTPLSTQTSGFSAPKAPASKPAVDSFSNLVHFGSSKNNANLSLRERQQQLEAEKRQRAEEQKKKLQSQYGGGQFWDTLGQGSSTASRTVSPALPSLGGAPVGTRVGVSATPSKDDDDEDLFAAFNKDTKVDTSTHFPRPELSASGTSTPANAAQLDLSNASAWGQPTASNGGGFGDDDDPFGLSQLKPRAQPQTTASADADDDILGDLGKPVDQVRRQAPPQPKPEPGKPIEDSDSDSSSEPESLSRGGRSGGSDPFDEAVAELVDMGFTAENARQGLTESGAGLNVQAAVGWLLDNAHRQARNKQTPRDSPSERNRSEDRRRSRNNGSPAWMGEGQTSGASRRKDNASPAHGDDLSKKAAAVGNSLFKTANSLWKSGQKQVQKAVADFQQDIRDPSQPKWMQSAQQERAHSSEKKSQMVTDEAMMLESGARSEKHSTRPNQSRASSSRDQSPALPTRPSAQSSGVPKWQQSASTADPRARINKQATEEQSAQAYVSPARRKKTTPQPPPQSAPEPDLLFNTSAPEPPQPRSTRSAQQPPVPSKPSSQPTSRTITPRPPPPRRRIPTVSPSILQASTKNRVEGTAQFNRGDYVSAHTSYTNSLAGIPQNHPLCIVLLTNRALTALKIGSLKQAVADADAAVGIIGPSRGEGEKVALPDGEQQDMKDLYGKALIHKADALQQMEKWSEAAEAWQQCIEARVGGANAVSRRQLCRSALAPQPKPATNPQPKPSTISDLAPQKDSEAVKRLRDANKAAEAVEEEKFALGDKVDARIAAWRDGKRDNLRALLGSLDQVLWEGSGWKKVGLHELVVANKVKIHYMKAIAKCHPDKLPRDADTEVRLIAATVFSTLNESWDKFKADNGM